MHAEFVVFSQFALKSIKQAWEFRSYLNVILEVLESLVLWMHVKLNARLWHNFLCKLDDAEFSKVHVTVTGNSNRVVEV